MTNPLLKAFGTALLAGGLSACSGPYTWTFNDRVVHNPGGSPRGELLADANLQGCLNVVLARAEDDDPAKLKVLACPSAGIESLIGIEALSSLEQLDLSDNRITDIGPLSSLRNLRVLSVRNNDIRNIGQLQSMPILRFVSLQGNSNIPCRQLDSLEQKLGNSLGRPTSCR